MEFTINSYQTVSITAAFMLQLMQLKKKKKKKTHLKNAIRDLWKKTTTYKCN